jgi:3-hydroxyacyl-[acyl-carrier-protein] dehydratase
LRNIQTETVGCLTGLRREGEVLTANFLFPAEFIGFRGHFPGKPVLPGVCQIHCVLAVVEQGEGVAVALREVVLAKYAAPVLPGEELVCTVEQAAGADGERLLKARLAVNGRKVTEMKLRVDYGAEPG